MAFIRGMINHEVLDMIYTCGYEGRIINHDSYKMGPYLDVSGWDNSP